MSRLKYSRMFSLFALAFTPIVQADIFEELASSGSGKQSDVDSAFAAMLGDIDPALTGTTLSDGKAVKAKPVKKVSDSTSNSDTVNVVKQKKRSSKRLKSDSYYLKNIPSNSMVVFNQEVKLLPRENHVHFKDGSRAFALPNSKPEPVTYCTVILNESGMGRRIKEGKSYAIDDVLSKSERYDVEGVGVMYKREVIFEIKNEHLKRIYCMSNEKNSELDLGDLKELSGGAVSINLRELLDI